MREVRRRTGKLRERCSCRAELIGKIVDSAN
ncbi:hypothetical protein M2350_000556 [Candidatus Fervidibacter sacchari]|uniref:Uncharacterized protein n=1 Tax=Candidatus Fervidibacter sacchari TaxID=1448929 RepID=A0ABT2EKE5_9BACT|nr:hypothetical protein [Candidatus Fervidibacter sacchari]